MLQPACDKHKNILSYDLKSDIKRYEDHMYHNRLNAKLPFMSRNLISSLCHLIASLTQHNSDCSFIHASKETLSLSLLRPSGQPRGLRVAAHASLL